MYGGPIKKYAQTTPSVNRVSSFNIADIVGKIKNFTKKHIKKQLNGFGISMVLVDESNTIVSVLNRPFG
jgi:hypothetical protein